MRSHTLVPENWMRTPRGALRLLYLPFALAAVALLIRPAAAQDAKNSSPWRSAIVVTLDSGATQWNTGDFKSFLGGYLDSQRTTYATHTKYLHGVAAIQKRYEADYFAPGAKRDSLSFEDVEIDSLAPNLAYYMGFYRLRRGDSTTARGPTSLLMQRIRGRWLIIHDHSG
jgi:ketosteroid isomerase-like protein